ncbi:MAG: histidine triad nucleotide-binding protein [Sedimenticola sp.]|nr:MAG: histidine triad nucleotide-binding protein [Sedimenticola sp.]
MDDCLFCKMVAGEITPDVVYEDDDVLAFRDLSPQAPVHNLVIPKRHISTLNDLSVEDAELMGKLFLTAQKIAVQEGIDQQGYRTVVNCNKDAGQTVFHIHMHVLGDRSFSWPPG